MPKLRWSALVAGLVLGLATSGWLLAGQVAQSTTAFAGAPAHRIAVHVDENDPQRMNMVLNNVQNLKAFYDSAGQAVE
ncbi:MAG: hypothetical protein ACFB13_19470, partial [Kiloniellaceae bacterium]